MSAPCPWCEDGGKPFPHRVHHPYFAYTIMCHVCFANGPHVKFDPNQHRKKWEDIVAPAIAEAWEKWNAQYVSLGNEEEAEEPPLAAVAS